MTSREIWGFTMSEFLLLEASHLSIVTFIGLFMLLGWLIKQGQAEDRSRSNPNYEQNGPYWVG